MTVPRAGTRFASVAALLLVSSLLVSFVASARVRSCLGASPTIIGSNRSEIIKGTSANDVIMGRMGRDRIWGGGGDDLICGGLGADIIRSGPGRDRLDGGRGADVVRAGGDDDSLRGSTGHDILSGGTGIDELDFSTAPGGYMWISGEARPSAGAGIPSSISRTSEDRRSIYSLTGDGNANQLVGGRATTTWSVAPGTTGCRATRGLTSWKAGTATMP